MPQHDNFWAIRMGSYMAWLPAPRAALQATLISSLWTPANAWSDDRLHAYGNVTNGAMDGLRGCGASLVPFHSGRSEGEKMVMLMFNVSSKVEVVKR